MIRIRIRDNRDVRGPFCGTIKHSDGTFGSLHPYWIVTTRNPKMRAYFEARLRGAFTTMGELR